MSEPRMSDIGVIEGFYGRHWSQQDRLSLAPQFSALGIDFYIYAPKSDSLLRRNWRESFPRDHIRTLTQLSATYQSSNVGFGIGLSPMDIWQEWDVAARRDLSAKIKEIETLNPSRLCILLDDMRGDIENLAQIQCEIMDFVTQETIIQKLVFCPTYYSFDPLLDEIFGDRPEDYLQTLGQSLAAHVDIFWTGPKVLSREITDEHLVEVEGLLGRKPLLWDNGLANDGKKSSNYLHIDIPEDYKAPSLEQLAGLVFNPMNQPWLSRYTIEKILAQYSGSIPVACKGRAGLPSELENAFVTHRAHFQEKGLNNLSAQVKEGLISYYQAFPEYPEVQEILDWLAGGYEFDPACLTD